MAAQCDPTNLLILGADLIEHFQLPQCCIHSLPRGVPAERDGFIVSIPGAEYAEFNKSKFFRFPIKSFPDLEDSLLVKLRDLGLAADPSEEFFVTDAKNLWLRTSIKSSADISSLTLAEEIPVIHSNVLPYDLYWRRPSPLRDEASSRVHLIPCCIFGEGVEEGYTLMTKLQEWRKENDRRSEGCDTGSHVESLASKKVWEINPLAIDVVTGKRVVDIKKVIVPRRDPIAAVQVSQVTWRGGNFIEKDTKNPGEFAAEVNAMIRLCHPHIVYIFGIKDFDGEHGSLYMECMERDLQTVILDPSIDPFSPHDSVDILLQIAKAMAHMHENKVIHGDLKSPNILISQLEIPENRNHYLAKVADLGSAQVLENSGTFKPSSGTTLWAAPEVIKFLKNKTEVISVPQSIDVYSFGIIAYEVLTGKNPYSGMQSFEVSKAVTNGTLKPHEVMPLRVECKRDNPLFGERLIPLIERCWKAPEERPTFSEIKEVLITVQTSRSDDSPRQGSSVDNSEAPKETASRSNGHHHQVNNVSVSRSGQVRGPSRSRRVLNKIAPCLSSGEVKR